jgi:riboflavin kinase/FMN adenylyltransferase
MTFERGGVLPPAGRPAALTWGVFDGVHLGHTAVLERLVAEARARGLASAALVFVPHPEEVLYGRHVPPLSSPEQRFAWIREAGVEFVALMEFTAELARRSPREFIEHVRTLVQPALVVLGHDARFGRGRAGDIGAVRDVGIEAIAVPPAIVYGTLVSSSRIREAVAAGDIALARRMLGRPFEIAGVVVRGAGRGASLGIPTANLEVRNHMTPRVGVYGCIAIVRGSEVRAVVNVGRRPTFEAPEAPIVVECHLIGWAGADLAGEPLRLRFYERLRDEQRFGSPEELVARIRADIQRWSHSIPVS